MKNDTDSNRSDYSAIFSILEREEISDYALFWLSTREDTFWVNQVTSYGTLVPLSPFSETHFSRQFLSRNPLILERGKTPDAFEWKAFSADVQTLVLVPIGIYLSVRGYVAVALGEPDLREEQLNRLFGRVLFNSGDLLLKRFENELFKEFSLGRLGALKNEAELLTHFVNAMVPYFHPSQYRVMDGGGNTIAEKHTAFVSPEAVSIPLKLSVKGEVEWEIELAFTSHFNHHDQRSDAMEECEVGVIRQHTLARSMEGIAEGLINRWKEWRIEYKKIQQIRQLLGAPEVSEETEKQPSPKNNNGEPKVADDAPGYGPVREPFVKDHQPNHQLENSIIYTEEKGLVITFQGKKVYQKRKQNGCGAIAYLIQKSQSRDNLSGLLKKNNRFKTNDDSANEGSPTPEDLYERETRESHLFSLESYEVQKFLMRNLSKFASEKKREVGSFTAYTDYYLKLDRETHTTYRQMADESAKMLAKDFQVKCRRMLNNWDRYAASVIGFARKGVFWEKMEEIVKLEKHLGTLSQTVYRSNHKAFDELRKRWIDESGKEAVEASLKFLGSKVQREYIDPMIKEESGKLEFYSRARNNSVQVVRGVINNFIKGLRQKDKSSELARYFKQTLITNTKRKPYREFSFHPELAKDPGLKNLPWQIEL